MIYRKTRTHHTGASNLPTRADSSEINCRQSRFQRNSVDAANSARADSLSRRINTDISPFQKTEQFYQQAGRTLKVKPHISVPRTAHLEEKDKRKNTFTGESIIGYDGNLESYRRPGSLDSANSHSLLKRENVAKAKRDIHATAIQETQLIGYDKHSVDTLKNNVSLEKVREAKRILRRRYANKSHLNKIYAAWDEEHKGTVTVENIYNMSQKLGLNLNMDEAKVLLASANKSGKGYLEMDEFFDLINNKDDALNLDLNSLSRNTDHLVKREELYNPEEGVIKKLEVDAKQMRDNKRMNQVSMILRNKLNQIIYGFQNADPSVLGFVSHKKFEDNLKQLGIHTSFVTEEDIKGLARKYEVKNSSKIDYRAFIEGLRNFRLDYDEMYKEYKQPIAKSSSHLPVDTIQSERDFNIVQCRDLPCNMVDNYLAKRRKVSVALKKLFPTKEEFKGHVSKLLNVNADQIDEQPISQNAVKDVISGIFDRLDISFIKKRDFEGFVSSFLYNKHGYTKVKDFSEAIYDEAEIEYYEKITRKKLGPPPHEDISGVTERKPILSRPGTEVNKQLRTQRAKSAGRFVSYTQDNTNVPQDAELRQILQKVDNKVFMGTKRNYEIYKLFDKDKDGYISHKDIKSKIQEYTFLQQDEISKLIEYVDPENKGYLTFHEFHSKIRPNMAQQNEQAEPTVLPSVMPCRNFNQKVVPKLKGFKNKIEEITKTYEGSYFVPHEVPTRFSASPEWVNTFLNFQPPSNSGMYIPETERLKRDQSQKIEFQREEKLKRTSHSLSRIEIKRVNQEQLQKKVEQDTIKQEKSVEANLKNKALQNMLFERRAKARNVFAF